MSSLPRTLVVTLVVLASVAVAEAGPIIYFDNYRSLRVDDRFFENSGTGSWSASAQGAQTTIRTGFQLSIIGEKRVDGAGHPYDYSRPQGSLTAFSRDPGGAAVDFMTSYTTTFQLDAPYAYDLDFFVDADGGGYAEGFLFAENTQTMVANAAVMNQIRRTTQEGILDPGIYRFSFLATLNEPPGFYDGGAGFGGELELRQFTPVPEPATMSLFGVGLAAAAWRRRKR
jgi:PEP-CTERM motif